METVIIAVCRLALDLGTNGWASTYRLKLKYRCLIGVLAAQSGSLADCYLLSRAEIPFLFLFNPRFPFNLWKSKLLVACKLDGTEKSHSMAGELVR